MHTLREPCYFKALKFPSTLVFVFLSIMIMSPLRQRQDLADQREGSESRCHHHPSPSLQSAAAGWQHCPASLSASVMIGCPKPWKIIRLTHRMNLSNLNRRGINIWWDMMPPPSPLWQASDILLVHRVESMISKRWESFHFVRVPCGVFITRLLLSVLSSV